MLRVMNASSLIIEKAWGLGLLPALYGSLLRSLGAHFEESVPV
jgi:hypothetical protein